MKNLLYPVTHLVLVSQSVSRASLLSEMGIKVEIRPSDFDEKQKQYHNVSEMVTELAKGKMLSYINSTGYTDSLPALSADTVVYYEGKIIGKADNEDEAEKQLRLLSGQTHSVFTGYCLLINGEKHCGYDCADVTFMHMSAEQIKDFIESGDWKGAAGSYRCNGIFRKYIKSINGDLNTVIGLPLLKISEIIRNMQTFCNQ